MITYLLVAWAAFLAGGLAGWIAASEYRWRRQRSPTITLRDNDGITTARSTYARRDEPL